MATAKRVALKTQRSLEAVADSLDEVLSRLDEIEAKVDQALGKPRKAPVRKAEDVDAEQ